MMERLAEYAAGVRNEGWTVETEQLFRVAIDRILLSGRADRVHRKDGAIRIADLKTSASPLPKREAHNNAQLAMYQLAVAGGGFGEGAKAAGAELVFLGASGDPIRVQKPIDREAAVVRLRGIVDELSKSGFEARTGRDCRICPVKRSCPAWPQGGQVTGP